VNLACKAVLKAITNLDFAKDDVEDYVPDTLQPRTLFDAICASSLRRQYFSAILKALEKKDLQLLRDVDIRWSSTLLMIESMVHIQYTRQALTNLSLAYQEWNALEVFRKILVVLHAFQQRLSSEKTPTLCYAIPSFRAMMMAWDTQVDESPDLKPIIESGLNKLSSYKTRMDSVPAYVLAMVSM
ncbi:hypothetical protein BDN67DRAFT_859307, partial [Paxillus ammoniavirescens]